MSRWGGRRAQAWTAAVLHRYGRVCALAFPEICTGVATTGNHKKPRSKYPHLQYIVSNGEPACLACNQHLSDNEHRAPVVVDATKLFESHEPGRKEILPSPPQVPEKTGQR